MINIKIFNIKQTDVFIKNGAIPIGAGLGLRGKVFVEFKEDEKFKKLMIRWMAKEF